MPFDIVTSFYFGPLVLKSGTRIAASPAPVDFIRNANIGFPFKLTDSEAGWWGSALLVFTNSPDDSDA